MQISQRVATAVNTAVEENSPISKLVGEVSTWWTNLDPTAEGVDPNGEDPTTTSKVSEGFSLLLPVCFEATIGQLLVFFAAGSMAQCPFNGNHGTFLIFLWPARSHRKQIWN